mmetsp:Transcript_8269/g.19814  ORF Transcript_8269/g.19814 Transcript_8269/m.19814 type:complete len:266 (-) Transcript_8269:124-921(-)
MCTRCCGAPHAPILRPGDLLATCWRLLLATWQPGAQAWSGCNSQHVHRRIESDSFHSGYLSGRRGTRASTGTTHSMPCSLTCQGHNNPNRIQSPVPDRSAQTQRGALTRQPSTLLRPCPRTPKRTSPTVWHGAAHTHRCLGTHTTAITTTVHPIPSDPAHLGSSRRIPGTITRQHCKHSAKIHSRRPHRSSVRPPLPGGVVADKATIRTEEYVALGTRGQHGLGNVQNPLAAHTTKAEAHASRIIHSAAPPPHSPVRGKRSSGRL